QELSAGGTGLTLMRLCRKVPGERSGERCPPAPIEALEVRWDEIRLEQALPSLRTDLLLLREGTPVLALEVYASHSVDEVKATKYRSLRLPWLEIPADRVAPSGRTGWIREDPIPVIGDSTLHPDAWRCPHHAALYEAWLEGQRNGV